jgi:hypothetical protein
MGRTACTEPQCLYKGDLYLYDSLTHFFIDHVLKFKYPTPRWLKVLNVLFVETVTRDKNCQIPHWTFNGIFSIHYKVLVQNIVPLMKWKTNRCHYFNFIHISTNLYMFRAHRPILRRIHTAVQTTIGSYSGCTVRAACSVQSTRPERYNHCKNQWLCEQLCEFSWGWSCRP